jgi:outer membrane protein assembly factor BamB
VVAIDTETGAVSWEYDVGAVSFLKYVDGRLYVTNTDEEIAALSPGGTELWRTTIDAEAIKGFHEQSGYVFLGTFSGHRVLHADTGAVVRARDATWEFLASAGGTVYTTKGSAPGTPTTYAVDGRRLAERWRVEAACSVSRPVVDAGRVYYSVDPEHSTDCSGQHRVWAYDATGKRQWEATCEHDLWYPAAADDRLFVPTVSDDGGSGSLVHLGRDGGRRWLHEAPGGLRDPTIAGGTVCAGPSRNDDAPLLALDAATGELLWTWDVSWDVRIATAGETLYVGDDGGLVALRD